MDTVYDYIIYIRIKKVLASQLLQDIIPQVTTEYLISVIVAIVSIIILWAVVSIPVWIAARILTLGRASFGRAMMITATGPIIFIGILYLSTAIISSYIIGNHILVNEIGIVLAFIALIYVFKRGFKTGWRRAAGITILAVIVIVIMSILISMVAHMFISSSSSITSVPLESV
jgi:hypothetical protein